MKPCDKCNYYIDDAIWCLHYYNPVEFREKIKAVMISAECELFKPKPEGAKTVREVEREEKACGNMENNKNFKEECWIIKGIKSGSKYYGILSYQGEGTFSTVDFDWTKAANKRVLGFVHTHPSGFTDPSDRDHRTMKALVRSEGRPLLCGILTERTQKCYIYRRKEDRTIESVELKSLSVLGKKIFIGEV